MGKLQEFLARYYGFEGASQTVDITLGAAALEAAPPDADRMSMTFLNLTANPVYLAMDAQVTAARGILLAGAGGQVGFISPEDGDLPTRRWFGVAPAGATIIHRISWGAYK